MKNQADSLRLLVQSMKEDLEAQIDGQEKHTKVITIASGKGGVGKSSFAVNLSLALSEFRQKVILLDADLGLANIDVILGISPPYNLSQVIRGEKSVSEVIYNGPKGIKIIPGGTGMYELANLQEWQLVNFLTKLSHLDGTADFFIIDASAGLSKSVLSFALAADEIIIVTTGEPTALTDAYGMIKTIRQQRYNGRVKLVVNRIIDAAEGVAVYKKLEIAVNRFLKYSLDYLGPIREDPKVGQAINEQSPLVLTYPHAPASQDILTIAASMSKQEYHPNPHNGLKGFFSRVAEYFR
ncbi:MAG: MinD/ParA family protein [Peptococcaceae bacterium]|jgi:flagellar biosynthesis protein FlhG|nr:MinD/ParA family protein [Peptococcaceae bacterium]MDH7524056.1 MinD/ParA family protein [Peptococcaceae bacterium]